MANHKSALKRHRQSEKRNLRNNARKSAIKTAVKKLHSAVTEGKTEEIAGLLKSASVLLDKAVTKGTLHRNTASRKISRITKQATATK